MRMCCTCFKVCLPRGAGRTDTPLRDHQTCIGKKLCIESELKQFEFEYIEIIGTRWMLYTCLLYHAFFMFRVELKCSNHSAEDLSEHPLEA